MQVPGKTVSASGHAMVRFYEGFQAHAYRDTGGVWTVGYGYTGPNVVEGMTVTQATAEALCNVHIAQIENSLNLGLHGAITQGQFDALADFAYNEGLGSLYSSNLWHCLHAGNVQGALAEFPKWIYGRDAHGLKQVLAWQVKRRAGEVQMFQTGQWTQ